MWTNAFSFVEIGAFLKEARKEKGITQAEMAKELGFQR